MRARRLLLILVPAGLVAAGGWWGWRWYTTPALPEISLGTADPVMVAAIDKAREDVRREPRSAATWSKLGMILAANDYHEPAAACFVQAERFDPTDSRWPYLHALARIRMGESGPALPALKRALALARFRDEKAAILSRLTLTLTREHHFDEAAEYLQQLREIDPNDPRLHYTLGLLALAQDRPAAAREHLSKVTEAPIARRQAHTLLATLPDGDLNVSRFHQEQAALLPADAAWPDPYEAELARHRVARGNRIDDYWDLEREGRTAEALTLLRQLAADSPGEEVCYTLGYTLYKAKEFEESARAFRASLRHNNANPKTHLFLGAALFGQGELRLREAGGAEPAAELFRQAVAAEDQALTIQNSFGFAHLIRGRALKHLRRTDEAIRALREATLCQPESPETHLFLGEALAEAGSVEEALNCFADAAKVAPPDDKRPLEAIEKWTPKAKPKP
jgi:tetratricopeptide (TPR) repeat protein